MQVARTHFKDNFAALIKTPTCSRGCVRIVIQSIFALIAATSFILIVMMAVKDQRPPQQQRCNLRGCRVMCNRTPYYGHYEQDISMAVAAANVNCDSVVLELYKPLFKHGTLPDQWLAGIGSNIHGLFITDGNLNHIPAEAFMSPFTSFINTLTLKSLNIKSWHANSLTGFSSLRNLNVIDCSVKYFEANSLTAVDDTLNTLTISRSGKWDPVNVTGSSGFETLEIVDFSNNDFNSILRRETFVGLEHCKILYLNSCGIVALGAGTFDHLSSIEVLYLNNNKLVTIPPRLFHNILLLENPRPRVGLQENFWHCSCDEHSLRLLVRNDILLVDSTCTYPSSLNGKTFTELENSCSNQTNDMISTEVNKNDFNFDSNTTFVQGLCPDTTGKMSIRTSQKFQIISAQKCSLNTTKLIDVSLLSPKQVNNFSSSWITFSMFLQTSKYNSLHIGAVENSSFGLLWFQSACPLEIYCMDFMPQSLRIYNIDLYSQFTFCPMRISSGDIEEDACIEYSMDLSTSQNVLYRWLVYATVVLCCTCFAAIVVYALIRMNPALLKGSKRILFVKHKTVDALVLPPKVPLRNDMINNTCQYLDKEIFTLGACDTLKVSPFNRMKSVRSNKSGSPSYISAVQPSEDQLAEWRIRHHFNNDLTTSSKSELSSLWLRADNPYYSFDESDTTYESLK